MIATYDENYLRRGLQTIDPDAHLHLLPSTTSTNDLAKAAAPTTGIVLAEEQQQGRGRLGRSFYSPPGSGIYLSIYFHHDIPSGHAQLLPFLTGIATCETLQELGIAAGLKWINDIIYKDRKAGGILCESRITANTTQTPNTGQTPTSRWVAGIGINILEPPGGFPPEIAQVATSLFTQHEKNKIPRWFRENLVLGITERLLSGVYNLSKSIDTYKKHCVSLRRTVEVLPRTGNPYLAFAEEILPDGRLLVKPLGLSDTKNKSNANAERTAANQTSGLIALDTEEIKIVHL